MTISVGIVELPSFSQVLPNEMKQAACRLPIASAGILGVPSGRKNPWTSIILNFFIQGLGYVYNGIGRDTGQLIFGILIFMFVFVGLWVGTILTALAQSPNQATSPSGGNTTLILLVFLLPFALAYGGYNTASEIKT